MGRNNRSGGMGQPYKGRVHAPQVSKVAQNAGFMAPQPPPQEKPVEVKKSDADNPSK